MSESPKHDCAALLAQADWVRSLARHLTADAAAAEDLAQEALAAALDCPPEEDRPLRAWLSGVVRNLVRHERRSGGERRARERAVARPEEVDASAELLERLELHRAVVAAVAELDEPYRTAVLLRYFEGLAPGAIARRTGAPVRTVHTRLHRALARLREALDRAHRGDRRAWLLALIPYARGSERSSLGAAGSLLMQAKLKVAVAALAAAAIGTTIVCWRGTASGASGAEPRAAPAPALVDAAPRSPARAAEEPPATAPEGERRALPGEAVAAPAPAPAAAEVARLAGRVLDVEQGPVPGIRVRFTPRGAGDAPLEAFTDGAGAFALERPGSGGQLDVASPGWTALLRPEFVEAPGAREVVLVIARSVVLGGRVTDEHGRGIEGARVALPLPLHLRARFDAILADATTVERTALSGPEGRFELAEAPVFPGAELLTTCAGYIEDRRAPPAFDTASLAIALGRAEEGPARLLGRVVDADGAGVEGAWVGFGGGSTRSGAGGVFALELADAELAPAAGGAGARVLRAVHPGFLPAERALPPGEPVPDPLVLALGPPPLAISGRVLDAGGAPVPGAEVWTDEETNFGYVQRDGGELAVSFGASVEGLLRDDPWTYRARCDSAGRFTLKGLLQQDYRLRAFEPGRLLLATERVAAGASGVELKLPAEELRSVAGRVTSLGGDPLPGMEVLLERPALGGGPAGLLEGRALLTDADGRFAFEPVARGADAVHVRGGELGLEGFVRRLAPEDDAEHLELAIPLRVHVQIDAGPDAGVERAALLDAAGERLTLSVEHGTHAYAMEEIALEGGRSESFSVSETAATLVLLAGGAEVRRLPVALVRGGLNTLRP